MIRPLKYAFGIVVLSAGSAWAQVALRPALDKEAEYVVVTSATVEQKESLAGEPREIQVTLKTATRIKHSKPNEQGAVSFERRQESYEIDGSFAGLKFRFDSAKPNEKASDPNLEFLSEILRKQFAAVFKYDIAADGKVGSVAGVEEGTLQNADDLKTEYQQEGEIFPTEPVKPGDAWIRTVEANLGDGKTLKFERQYTYMGAVDKFATVKGGKQLDKLDVVDKSVTMAIKPGRGTEGEAKESKIEIEKSAGQIMIDRELGRVVSVQHSTKLAGTYVISGPNGDRAGRLMYTSDSERKEKP